MKRLEFKAAKTTYYTPLKVFIIREVSENSFGAIYLSRFDLPLAEQLNIQQNPFLLMKKLEFKGT